MYIKSPQYLQRLNYLWGNIQLEEISSFGVLLRRSVLGTLITLWSINKKKTPWFRSKLEIIDRRGTEQNYRGKERWDWWTLARFLAAVSGWLRIMSQACAKHEKKSCNSLPSLPHMPRLLTLILILVSSLKLVREKMSRFRRESEAIFSLVHDCKVHQKSSKRFDAIFSKTNSEDYVPLS